jgi:hypothetical protein
MKHRILGLAGGKRRRRLLLATLASAVALGAVLISSALAVHDLDFQLDGNIATSPDTTSEPGTTQEFDWEDFFDDNGDELPLPTGFDASTFDDDFQLNANGSFNTADRTTWATGSKDTQNINGGGSGQSGTWQCKRDNNLLDKNDIMNAYAVSYAPTGGDEVLYFGLERNGNEGAASVGFWFLQDGTVDCVGPETGGGAVQFDGNHRDGDLLVVSEFTNGGTVSTIKVFRWVGGINGCVDNPAPTSPGSCDGQPITTGGDCITGADPNDAACATVNNGTLTNIPWLTAEKTTVGHTLFANEFFEGGVNLTDTNLGDKCFNTFLASTRASQELGANLHDFSRGNLGACTSDTETTPTPAAGSETQIPANAQVTTRDSAKITVTGAQQFDGTVAFSLCGPLPLDSTSNCQTGGAPISTATLDDATSGVTVQSDAVTLTRIGKYCWRAVYSGDPARQVPGSSDPDDATNQSECFRITPKTPTLTTCAGTYSATVPPVCTPAGPVDFGQPVIDRANLTGTANRPGTGGLGDGSINPTGGNGPAQGTITFKLYGPDTAGSTANCNTLAAGFATAHPNGIQVNVNGDGVYGPVSFTPEAPGVYHWKATYDGDLLNPNTEPSGEANSNCTDPNEDVTVRQIPTDIKTKQSWFPNDTATITSTVAGDNLGAGGTVDFTLHPTADCTGTALYSERQTLTGGTNSEEVTTHNYPGSTAQTPGGVTVTPYREDTDYDNPADSTVGPNSWKVVYTPTAGDTAHLGSQSACTAGHTEKHAITYTNDPGGPPNP